MIKKHNIVIAADPFYQHLPYHTYLLSIDGIPRYAGKGSGSISRPQAHMRRMRDIDFANPFAIWEILRFFEEEDQAIVHEKALIKQYGRLDIGTGTLFNKTNGGERGGGRGYAVLVEWAHCDIVPQATQQVRRDKGCEGIDFVYLCVLFGPRCVGHFLFPLRARAW